MCREEAKNTKGILKLNSTKMTLLQLTKEKRSTDKKKQKTKKPFA